MKIIDSHCHIFKEYYDDIPFLMSKLSDNNIGFVINNGVDLASSKEVVELSNIYEYMYASVGIHPEDANMYNDSDLDEIKYLIGNKKVIAIGEIGLDYHYEGYDKNKQIELFEKELRIAEDNNLPVIIHSRDAGMDTLNILKKYHVKGIIHSFSGSYEMAKEYIKLGFYLGINGVVTFKNAHLIDVIKEISLDYFVLETDSPYLTPEPFRGMKNDSSYLNIIVKFLSTKLNLSEDEIISTTCKNVYQVFDKIICQ